MSVFDWLRKGFGYVLLSMGVSRPAPKPRPATSSSDPASDNPSKPERPTPRQ